ncbi:hypothetical protein [Streptomyces sp. NPDC057694]|uniref:hypothetical protein n=1 Tax=Streptomyces sp. NPDC057694 TaxID=3346216 RepID=UPI0036855FA3
MNDDGIAWVARAELSWLGYCLTFARGLSPEQLVTRLAAGAAPDLLGEHTATEAEE